MAQNLNLSFSGIYTSINDFNGLPPGALDAADNIECRYKNVGEPRRGFQAVPATQITSTYLARETDFFILNASAVISLSSANNLNYYTGSAWAAVPGNYSSNILPPDAVNGKSRFLHAGQNLYLTAQDGVRSIASGSGSNMIRAGVAKGLNLQAVTNGDITGFLTQNNALVTTGTIATSSANINNLNATAGISVGQYVGGIEIAATLVVQDLTYTAVLFGVLGNAITITYTGGGTAGAEIVSVVGTAISVQIQNSASTATQVRTAINASAPALALVSCAVTGTGSSAQVTAATTPLAGGLDNTIPIGTTVLSITNSSTILIATANTTAGSADLSNLVSLAGLSIGNLVSGSGVAANTTIASLKYVFTCSAANATVGAVYTNNGHNFTVLTTISSGTTLVCSFNGAPTNSGTLTKSSGSGDATITFSSFLGTVVMNIVSYQTQSGGTYSFASSEVVTMSANALASLTGTPISFYAGAQVGYRMVFGRVEQDIDGGTISRLGTPSAVAIATNTTPYTTDVTVTGTIPKNSSDSLTFVQLYRSQQTVGANVTPLDQYSLVYERNLVAGDFTARTITITDSTPDSLLGIPLYSGSDQEGILQTNDPPPMCWDICKFRDFVLYGNVTSPSTFQFSIVGVGSPNGVQVGDTITVAGSFLSVPFSEAYTGASSENQAARQFKVVTSGTPAQNITDTANSLIRVINYDNALPVHAILLSSQTSLPGLILLESDNPSYDTFTVTANAHTAAYSPALTGVVSAVNTINNGVRVSKSGEYEAVPGTNEYPVGDTSSDLYRMIALRDYVIVIKSDGIYKILGTTPGGLVINTFDLTTKVIGADTVVSLNSAVWMLSNQGVVSISDGGVQAKSIPIDDQINAIIGSHLDNVKNVSFAMGYESDRKYILCMPASGNPYCEIEFNYNYITSAWTTWSRLLYSGFIHSTQDVMYVGRADPNNQSMSKERKTGTYQDYVDEAIDATITTVVGQVVTLLDVSNVVVGDILYQSGSIFSPVIAVNLLLNTVTTQFDLAFTAGACTILKAFLCTITWKQVFADNPSFVRQFSEGLALFKNTRFNVADIIFVSDFSQNEETVPIAGTGVGLWGLFGWGELPWGGEVIPSNIRFLVPQNKQLGSFIIPTLKINQGYSDFKFQGLSIVYFPVSPEVGL